MFDPGRTPLRAIFLALVTVCCGCKRVTFYSALSDGAEAGSLHSIMTAQETYKSTYPKIGYACTLEQLGGQGGGADHSGLIDTVLASGRKSGYVYSLTNCTSRSYRVAAVPESPQTGRRSFCADQNGVIRYSDDGAAESCFKLLK